MKHSDWKSFLNLCLKAKNTDELANLFDFFFTTEERESFADRYAIIKALLENKETQRELSDSLKVSIAKITRGSNALKRIDPILKSFLERETR